MTQTFTISGRLPGMNEYSNACRINAYKGAQLKRDAEEAVMWAAKAARIKPMEPAVMVRITWVEKDMRRDKDNIRTGAKFILDALVKLGILGNDNWHWIEDISDAYMVNKSDPRVIVELSHA